MAYTYGTVSPTPAWVTIDGTGTITVNSAAIPDQGYQGSARFSVSDGVSQVFLDVPIDIAPSYAWAAANTTIVDWAESTSITWAATIGASFSATQIFEPLDLVWSATIGASFEDTVATLPVYEDSIDLNQFVEIATESLGILSDSVDLGQSIADGFSDGLYLAESDLTQTNALTFNAEAIRLASVDLTQSIADDFAGSVPASTPTESNLVTGLTFAQSSLYAGTTAADQSRMTDSSATTYAATTNVGNQWIEVSFSSRFVCGLMVGGGNGSGFGNMATYLNGRTIEYWDGSAWVALRTIAGITDSGGTQFRIMYFGATTTTKIRLFAATSWLATADMYPIVLNGASTESQLTTGLTFAQSTNFSGDTIATLAKMTDGIYTTVAATGSGANWIEVSFAEASVRGLVVASSSTGGWNNTYLNNRTIEYWDGSAWITAVTVAGVVNDTLASIYFPLVTTTKLRLYTASGFVATAEMRPIVLS